MFFLHLWLAPTVWQCLLVKLTTVANRAFPVVDPLTWNDLSDDMTSAVSKLTKLLHLTLSRTGLHLIFL